VIERRPSQDRGLSQGTTSKGVEHVRTGSWAGQAVEVSQRDWKVSVGIAHLLKMTNLNSGRQNVFMTANEDGAIVLDICGKTENGNTGRLIKFDGIGAQMWKLLCSGQSPAQVVDHILSEYTVDRQTVERDLANLLSEAKSLGLKPDEIFLAEAAQTMPDEQMGYFPWYAHDGEAPRPTPSRIMVFAALVGLCLFDFLLSAVSMEVMCHVVHRWPLKQRKPKDDRIVVIGKICTAVERSCVWYGKKALCLQRSAVTACMLRAWGIAAEMVLAVRPMPTVAHAWVEVAGSVINDRPQVRRFYRRLTAY